MGKPPESARKQLLRLRRTHRKLSSQLAKIDRELVRLTPDRKQIQGADVLNRWLDELSEGLPPLPLLPLDFSRADLYEDHD